MITAYDFEMLSECPEILTAREVIREIIIEEILDENY